MPQMQPDQADFLLQSVYLPGLRNEHNITKKVIQAIPNDKGDYRPDGISKSAFDLAWHVVSTEMRFMDAVAAGQFDLSPRPLPDSIKSSGDLAGWYAENFEPRFEKLAKLSDRQLLTIVDFRGLFQMPAVMYLRIFAASFDPPSRAVIDVSAAHGSESAGYLRRKLRFLGGAQSRAVASFLLAIEPGRRPRPTILQRPCAHRAS